MRASTQLVWKESPAGIGPVGVSRVIDKTPTCTCGWTGQRRFALALARHDAWMHAATTSCHPGVPFVIPRGAQVT